MTSLLVFSSLVLNAQDLDLNLLINYPFSNDFQDQSVNQLHGSGANVSFVEDRFGVLQNAAFFDGSSCVEFPNNEILKPQFPFSIGFWVKPEVEFIRAEGIVGTDQFQDNYYGAFISILSSGKMMIGYGDGCGETGPNCRVSEISTRIFENNEWYHIVAIFKTNTEIELYVNGCKVNTDKSGTGTEQLMYSDEPGAIGKKDHSDIATEPIGFFHGTIDDFYYWDRAISDLEINALVDNYYGLENSFIEYQGCQNDGYFIEVNGIIYNEENPNGIEIISDADGCQTFIEVNLEFLPTEITTIENIICDDPSFSLLVNNELYNIKNPFGTESLINDYGCESITNINLIFANSTFGSFAYTGCEGDNYFIEINQTRYDEFNPNGIEKILNSNGCDSILDIQLIFQATPICYFYLPNIISAHAQYPNNTFKLYSDTTCNYNFLKITIFDRWGNLVFISSDENFIWIGQFRGRPLSNAVYTYKMDYSLKNQVFFKTGSITVLKD